MHAYIHKHTHHTHIHTHTPHTNTHAHTHTHKQSFLLNDIQYHEASTLPELCHTFSFWTSNAESYVTTCAVAFVPLPFMTVTCSYLNFHSLLTGTVTASGYHSRNSRTKDKSFNLCLVWWTTQRMTSGEEEMWLAGAGEGSGLRTQTWAFEHSEQANRLPAREKNVATSVYIQRRAKCRHRYATMERNEAIKSKTRTQNSKWRHTRATWTSKMEHIINSWR